MSSRSVHRQTLPNSNEDAVEMKIGGGIGSFPSLHGTLESKDSSLCGSGIFVALTLSVLFPLIARDACASDVDRLIVRRAESFLSEPIVTVMDKSSIAPSGDKHDYFALAPYHWPNPNSADGLPYVFRDGQVNPEANGDQYDRVSYFRMGDAIACLAVAYDITKDSRFAARSAEWLRAWFVEPATMMNPNLAFAQCIRGDEKGLPIGLIRGNTIIDVMRAERLIAEGDVWTQSDHDALVAWIRDLRGWLLESDLGKNESRAANNHGTWYAAQVVTMSVYLGDPAPARRILNDVRRTRLRRQISPDGRQPLELIRTKSWDYSVMNLQGLVVLADAGSVVGVDLWHTNVETSRSIRGAIDYLVPFALGEKEWHGAQIRDFEPDRLVPILQRARQALPDSGYAAIANRIPVEEPQVALDSRLLAVSLEPRAANK